MSNNSDGGGGGGGHHHSNHHQNNQITNIENNINDDSTRVLDYFAVVGLPNWLTTTSTTSNKNSNATNKSSTSQSDETATTPNKSDTSTKSSSKIEEDNFDRLRHDSQLLKNRADLSPEPVDQIRGSAGSPRSKDPIVDIAVINRSLNEPVPLGYECIFLTIGRRSANLCGEGLIRANQQMFLVFKRGLDRPPITDIGIFYEGPKEQVMADCEIVKTTFGTMNSANLNTNTFLNAERTFITFRRATQLACNSLAVVDICVVQKVELFTNRGGFYFYSLKIYVFIFAN